MKLAVRILALLLLAAGIAFPQSAEKQSADMVLLSSPDALGSISIARLNSCFHQLLREWHHDDKPAPRIVVMHVSRQAAHMASVTTSPAVRRNRCNETGDSYYEVWFVDTPKIDDYLLAFENVIEQHYGLTPNENERKQAMQHAALVENATISVNEGR